MVALSKAHLKQGKRNNMPSFGSSSAKHLKTLHPNLQAILLEAIEVYDFSILCGHRSQQEQDKLFAEGKSKLKYPDSRHNQYPSNAVDIAPYPIDWEDTTRFARLAGFIEGIAHTKGIKLRLGFDWDGDNDISEHSFLDFPHIELKL